MSLPRPSQPAIGRIRRRTRQSRSVSPSTAATSTVLVAAALLLGVVATPAAARPAMCRDTLSPNSAYQLRNSSGPTILDWQETICLEHEDRVRRMQRLSNDLPPEDRPTFFEFMMPKDRLPPNFRSDVPLLRVVFPEHSFFDTASSSIRPEALRVISLIAESLRSEVPDVAVFVAGHTDARGGEDYNQNLSIDRADAVARQLQTDGVGGVALWRVGFGKAAPLVPNDTPANMALNRRVEFVIGARTEPVASWLSTQLDTFCSSLADVSQCKKVVGVRRHEFDAVAVTERSGLTVAPPVAPRARAQATVGRTTVAAPVARQHLVIDLDARKYRIPPPN